MFCLKRGYGEKLLFKESFISREGQPSYVSLPGLGWAVFLVSILTRAIILVINLSIHSMSRE
jgi:hypothetical protein